ncbi:hypothetical protein G9A89_008194 [Geosiphon pyriformis]|nr:hypothetical protein G9A89_008194 [Geosiphon pyriformis]
MAYAPITKLKKFTDKEDNIQVWLNDVTKAITANNWDNAIQADYFTAPQILNQFIRGLHSSILQHIRPLYLIDFQAIITNTRDFEAAKLEANHTQVINLVMNGSSDLDSKLKQFSDSINQKLEGYLANTN